MWLSFKLSDKNPSGIKLYKMNLSLKRLSKSWILFISNDEDGNLGMRHFIQNSHMFLIGFQSTAGYLY